MWFAKYYWGDQVEEDKMGGACDMYGGEEEPVQVFGGEICRKETTWKNRA